MTPLKLTGGASIGIARATWPFATLTVTNERLDLNVPIIGSYSFTADQIISIEPICTIPLIRQGIRINHTISNYKKKVIFWSSKDPQEIIYKIGKTGFGSALSSAAQKGIKRQVIEKQKQGGFPVRISAAISIIVIWNILFIVDFIDIFKSSAHRTPFGKGSLIAFGFILSISILTLTSKVFRQYILKDGRDIKEISRFLYFLILLSGIILLMQLSFPAIK
jgi:hypothetical protein